MLADSEVERRASERDRARHEKKKSKSARTARVVPPFSPARLMIANSSEENLKEVFQFSFNFDIGELQLPKKPSCLARS